MSIDIKSVSSMTVGRNPSLADHSRQSNTSKDFAKSLDGVENKKNHDDKKAGNALVLNRANDTSKTDDSSKVDATKKGKGKDSANDKELKNLLGDLTDTLTNQNLSIAFEIDKDIHQTIVKVTDKNTGEVIRQMPSKEMLDHLKHLKDLSEQDKANKLVGILFDKKV